VQGARLFVEGEARPLTIASADPVADGPGWWITFEEIGGRAAAERLRERYLEIEVDRDADLAPGQAYWHEIVGSEVLGRDGRSLGHVVDIYRAGESEVYVVRGDAVGEFDLPAVRGIVTGFTPEEGRITVDEAALALDERPIEAPPKRARKAHGWSRHGKGARPASPEAGPAAPDAP
jgi:16S rRNA processing protein RimM